MNTTELPVRPEVASFVARVREHLSDLPAEELLDLTEGLEADLGELVAERGGGALGDPAEYARELRAAAGLGEPRRRLRMPRVDRRLTLDERLDRYAAWWRREMDRKYLDQAWPVVVALRPAWWVARAWVAAVIICIALPGYTDWGYTWLPGVDSGFGILVMLGCIAGSALVGLGRLWPGSNAEVDRGTAARVTLIALNVFAILMVPAVMDKVQEAQWHKAEAMGLGNSDGWVRGAGVVNRGEQVCNISAYDAAGQPLVGVQLFDQAGRPLATQCYSQARRTVPWMLGDVPRWNVFPLAERDHPARTAEQRADVTGARFPTPDRATTPQVTNPVAIALVEQRAQVREERKLDRQAQRQDRRQEERAAGRR